VDHPVTPDFLALLRTMVENGVDFIVVGGVSAVLQGSPVTTFDLDLVHSREPENITRLLSTLQALDAYYRGRGTQILRPGRTHLATSGHQLLMTRHGPLDLLGTIGAGHSYDDLLKHTVKMQIDEFHVRVLDLQTLIKVKEEVGHDKDKAMLPILRRTLEEHPQK
jgi:hypothetical protein